VRCVSGDDTMVAHEREVFRPVSRCIPVHGVEKTMLMGRTSNGCD